EAEARPADYSSDSSEFVRAVIEFQLSHGATAIIPPYPHLNDPEDLWLPIALEWLREARAYLDSAGVALPMVAILCGQLMKFGAERAWTAGLDRFAREALQADVQAIGLCLSPIGTGRDSYNK